jgi:hypothetical protein
MTLEQFQRAQIVQFAVNQAAYTGSLPCMKGVCYVLRNRVRKGWYDGSWIAAIEHAPEVAGNEPQEPKKLNLSDRLFQMMLRDVDEIFFGGGEDETHQVVNDALYFMSIDRSPRAWFVENIVRDDTNHPRRAHIGPIAFHA